jgi:LemA protein
METIYIILAIIAVVVLYVIALYNGLIKLKNRVKEAWSDIDVQLKRRYNLIPNLVETVKGYATHEKELFENVTKARTAAMGATGVKDKAETENMLTGALKSLFAVSENYPDLKASENFVELQRELRDTEDKIQAARRFYNTNARDMNIKIESFPANLIAKPLGFKMVDFFEIEEPKQRENIKVEF